jgi:hypothetical protein
LDIEIKEVLRYLGHKNQVLDESTKQLVSECVQETKGLVRANYVYRDFDILKDYNVVNLKNTNISLTGIDIYEHLKYSNRCFLMAATIGSEIDYIIRYYEKADLTKAVIIDACATAAIEALCDEVEERVKEEALKEGFGITYRYSPGYGDLPIELQPSILNLLETQKKIGLTVSDSLILLPRKSVSAVIGIQGLEVNREYPGCKSCSSFKYCEYRKGGSYCGA